MTLGEDVHGTYEPTDGTDRDSDWSNLSKKLEGFVPDMMRKTAVGAIKGVLQTEEGVRAILGEVSKEVVSYAREQIDKGKSDLVQIVAREFREFLEHTDLAGEMQKVLTQVQLEVKTEIRFVPADDGGVEAKVAKPTVKKSGASRTRKTKTTSRPKKKA